MSCFVFCVISDLGILMELEKMPQMMALTEHPEPVQGKCDFQEHSQPGIPMAPAVPWCCILRVRENERKRERRRERGGHVHMNCFYKTLFWTQKIWNKPSTRLPGKLQQTVAQCVPKFMPHTETPEVVFKVDSEIKTRIAEIKMCNTTLP